MITAGNKDAQHVLILLHGRGGTAENIATLKDHLPEALIIAPQAPNREWYPHSFLRETSENEPKLSESLVTVKELLNQYVASHGAENVFIAGFSQGACLTAEVVATLPNRYGGVGIFSGGVIGKLLRTYQGDLKKTPVYIGGSEQDPFIPLHRIKETASIYAELGADIVFSIYPGGGHTIMQEELSWLSSVLGSP